MAQMAGAAAIKVIAGLHWTVVIGRGVSRAVLTGRCGSCLAIHIRTRPCRLQGQDQHHEQQENALHQRQFADHVGIVYQIGDVKGLNSRRIDQQILCCVAILNIASACKFQIDGLFDGGVAKAYRFVTSLIGRIQG